MSSVHQVFYSKEGQALGSFSWDEDKNGVYLRKLAINLNNTIRDGFVEEASDTIALILEEINVKLFSKYDLEA